MNQQEIAREVSLNEVQTPSDCPKVFRVECDRIHSETYIIQSEPALNILLRPWLVGSSLANLARDASIDFLRVAYYIVEMFRNTCYERFAELVPLAGGLYYSIAEAFERLFGETINRCFIGARRHRTPTGWKTKLAYENFEALPKEPLVIIGDTIATGGTLERIINSLLAQNAEIRAIIIFSIAGGLPGAVRVKEVADRVNAPMYLFYSNAIFGVEDNGTDMPWLHPATITTHETRERALSTFGPELGRRWCSIWDWGDRSKHPLKHLHDLLDQCEYELTQPISEATRKVVLHVRNKVMQSIERWNEQPSL